jgi:hypothetical protein
VVAKLVSHPSQVPGNIRRFQEEVSASADMQSRLAYNRAWYAERTSDDVWEFGPSKFIGYQDMTAAKYDPKGLNGRETERQLSQWYTQLDPSDAIYHEIDQSLRSYLAMYGKTPSALYRLNISNECYEDLVRGDIGSADDKIADLIIAVARKLNPEQRGRVRAALK